MDDITHKECETLRLMMQNWRRGFLTWVEPGVESDYILREFKEEITDQLMPYVYRLIESKHLTLAEATELMNGCFEEVDRLKEDIKKLKGGSDG